jgi:hypothetical protein
VRSLFDRTASQVGPVLSGDLRATGQGSSNPFRFQLTAAPPALDRIAGEGTFSSAAPSVAQRRLAARVKLDRVVLDPYLVLAAQISRAAADPDATRTPSDPAREAPGLAVQIDAQIAELRWRTLVLERGDLAWARDGRGSRLSLRPQRALGGNLTGELLLRTQDTSAPRLQWNLEADALDARQLISAFRQDDAERMTGGLRGRSQGDLRLGPGPAQGSGATQVEITNGRFGGSDLLDFLATHTRIAAIRRMGFETLAADLRLEGDQLQVAAVDVRSPVAGLAMTGAIDRSGTLDLRVLSRVGPDLERLLSATEYSQLVGGTLDRFLTLPILVLVTGTLEEPAYSVRPTTSSVTGAAWETVSRTGQLIRRKTRSILQRTGTVP